jgi:hypothetical protein
MENQSLYTTGAYFGEGIEKNIRITSHHWNHPKNVLILVATA